jgi:hypothetical protein
MKLCNLFEIQSSPVTWVYPNIDDEMNEIERTSQELDINLQQLLDSFQHARLITLNDTIWSRLDNTDSYDIEQGDMESVTHLSSQYGKDLQSILRVFSNAGSLPAPIVMKSNGRYYLIAGNTRLMAARVHGVIPKVLLVVVT